MVGADRNRLEAGAGEEQKRGGGGRKDRNRHCRDDNNNAGDGVIGFRKGIGGGRSHWGPVAPVGRNGVGQKSKVIHSIPTTRDTRDYVHVAN